MTGFERTEHSSCGVGFLVDRRQEYRHDILQQALRALRCVEHRGACAADQSTGDGAGVMTDIPFDLFGFKPGSMAVATLFMPQSQERMRAALNIFESTFRFYGLHVASYRPIPVDASVLGDEARRTLPSMTHCFIARPPHCRTDASFERVLYAARQRTRTELFSRGISKEFFFTSLSASTIIYKGLVRAEVLDRFYLDLQQPAYATRFAMLHRRFSTNTRSTWDKAQPFRLIGHNGEINTIAGNRSWAVSREMSLGLAKDQLLTHAGHQRLGEPQRDGRSADDPLEHPAHRGRPGDHDAAGPRPERFLHVLEPGDGTVGRPCHHSLRRREQRGRASRPERVPSRPVGRDRRDLLPVIRGRRLRDRRAPGAAQGRHARGNRRQGGPEERARALS